jgi:hypothetical protein
MPRLKYLYVPKYKSGFELADEAMAKQVAALVSSGVPISEIMKRTGMKRGQVERLVETDECKGYIRDIGETALVSAKHEIKKEVAKLAPLVVETIKAALLKNNLNAIPHALKILGFSENEQEKGDTNIQVVLDLGDNNKKPDIEVEGLKVEKDEIQNGKN